MMELKEAIRKVREGKIVFDGSKIKEMKYFLFMWNHDELYYIHDKTINEDKKRVAVLENAKPNLLAVSWWENKWKVWETSQNQRKAK